MKNFIFNVGFIILGAAIGFTAAHIFERIMYPF